MRIDDLPGFVRERILEGTVIPAIPLALDAGRAFDPRHQRALIRYYMDSGAGGVAVGVHTTQFEIRDPRHGLFKPVLSAVSRMIDEGAADGRAPIVKVGGICGKTEQALAEAEFLAGEGYHAGLLSLAAMKGSSTEELLEHARRVAEAIPLIGFSLQPAVGGLVLPYEFWRAFAAIPNVLAIKIAPFNRYRTIDVVRAVCDAGRENEVALYTGNDDHIVMDLLSAFPVRSGGAAKTVRIVGGLLGQWSVWTKRAVELHAALRDIARRGADIPASILTLAEALTDANAAIFDAANGFAGCIPGIHEILRRQGLLAGTWCLDPNETLSPGQAGEIDRVCAAYPDLGDDEFVKARLPEWLA
jgi:dihydrodipicolinate synthase/N-acetylneuraminate lyase